MATMEKVTYKRYNGSGWDTVYFYTTANSVKETTGKRFLVPATNTVNGKSFFDTSNNAQSITLTGSDIGVTFAGSSTVTTIGSATNVAAALTELVEGIEGLQSQINGLTGGGVVTGVTTPSMTDAKGLIDLTSDFANYFPTTGGTISGDVTIENTLTVGSTLTVGDVEASSVNADALTVTGNATIANLTVTGTTTTVNATNLEISDNLITVAKGNTTAITKPAGLVVPKYDGTNYGALYFDSTGTAYVGDVALDTNGQINTSSNSTTALPLTVRDKSATYAGGGAIAVWELTDGNPYLKESSYKINNTAASFTTSDSAINTYGAMKSKVAGSIGFANNVITLKAVDGSTSLGTVTLGAAASKALDTSTLAYGTTSTNVPTTNTIATYVKSFSNRTFYANTTPTDARTGDLWFDTTGAATVS